MALSMLRRQPDSGLGNIKSSGGAPRRNIDWILLVPVILLGVIGIFNIYSATFWKIDGDPYWFTTRQVVYMLISVLILGAVMTFDYTLLRERSAFFYGSMVFSLILVLSAGAIRGGARLSFDLGIFSFQPAEFAKPVIVLTLAAYLSERRDASMDYSQFVRAMILIGVPIALIIAQPDLGSAFVIIIGALAIFVMAGTRLRYLMLISLLTIATMASAVAAGIVDRYQLRRIEAFVNQNSTDKSLQQFVFQVRYAKRAVATGGWFGKGYLEGPLTNGKFVPVQQSDFIFSAIAEQFGMIGAGLVLFLFGVILFRIWRIAQTSKDMFGTFLCVGIFGILSWHIFQNIGMTMGIMPVTGIPLPLMSYGGSSLIASLACLGLVVNVHARRFT